MLTFAKYLGGSPANTAIGVARLGLKPAMLTRVGDEHNGRFVRETLAAEGVDVSHVITDPKRLTALAILGIRDRETFPLLFYREHCADMAIAADDFDAQFIASALALCVSGTHLSQPQTYAACVAAMREARDGGHAGRARHRLPAGAVGTDQPGPRASSATCSRTKSARICKR